MNPGATSNRMTDRGLGGALIRSAGLGALNLRAWKIVWRKVLVVNRGGQSCANQFPQPDHGADAQGTKGKRYKSEMRKSGADPAHGN